MWLWYNPTFDFISQVYSLAQQNVHVVWIIYCITFSNVYWQWLDDNLHYRNVKFSIDWNIAESKIIKKGVRSFLITLFERSEPTKVIVLNKRDYVASVSFLNHFCENFCSFRFNFLFERNLNVLPGLKFWKQ